tara:strand:- start:619 stop:1245 length:627 start_codon:yes stop_codon:yes gene_type:complete
MSKTKEFLKNFKDRLFLFGSKEGRQAKYDESKKSFLGMPLPEFGVSEFLNLPDTSKARERQKTEKQNQQIEQAKKNAEFKRKLEEAQGGNLNLDAGSIKAEDVDYGPKRRAGDLLERYVNQQVDQSQTLGYNQALMNQEAAFAAERNRQNLETTLAFDRDSPTKQQERQFKAKYGEALLAEAIAKQATAGAAIGGLQSQTKFGSGRVN